MKKVTFMVENLHVTNVLCTGFKKCRRQIIRGQQFIEIRNLLDIGCSFGYILEAGRHAAVAGFQAIVRLILQQRELFFVAIVKKPTED